MIQHPVVPQADWLAARKALLEREKAFLRERDALSAARRALPWVRVEKRYVFEGPAGQETLAALFEGRHQLIVQHFMFDPNWEAGCKSCSFWADGYDGAVQHLRQRDVTFVAVSTAPLAKLEAFRRRMGWHFKWVSAAGSDFSRDFYVTYTPEELAAGPVDYNYAPRKISITEMPGTSVFYRDDDDTVYHTYSCYARGLDMMNVAYQYLDLVPKGRDEDGLPFPMTWVRLHDQYTS
jgi:predicted dithiol-disulfide oxidoreductase (DUF899 family)